MTKRHLALKTAAVATVSGAFMLGGAATASAHVRVDPSSTTTGEFSVLTFRVPNEEARATTTKLTITLPQTDPFTSVSTRPVPGWKVSTHTAKLPKPVTVDGAEITKAVRTVTWTARAGHGIRPEQFQLFSISVGPLPTSGSQVLIPATQKYSNGDVVRWDQEQTGDKEPPHPAPAFDVTAAQDPESADESDTTARWLGGAGLAVGVVGLGAGAAGLRRRTPRTTR